MYGSIYQREKGLYVFNNFPREDMKYAGSILCLLFSQNL